METATVSQKVKLYNILLRPQVYLKDLKEMVKPVAEYLSRIDNNDALEQAEIMIKYEGYIDKEFEMAERVNKLEDLILHNDLKYENIKSLSSEAQQKLAKVKPRTLGQASRISGVSPSDISILMVYLGR
jgi:tRNA uridine 5-carboxymethylaminomethyl modification enzyme